MHRLATSHRHTFGHSQVLIRTRCQHPYRSLALASTLVGRPLPAANLGTVHSMLVSMMAACDLKVAKFLFGVRADPLQSRDAVNRVDRKTEPVRLVVDGQFHRRVDVALLLVTANMQVVVICAAIGETVN